jgi:hypothetical protein
VGADYAPHITTWLPYDPKPFLYFQKGHGEYLSGPSTFSIIIKICQLPVAIFFFFFFFWGGDLRVFQSPPSIKVGMGILSVLSISEEVYPKRYSSHHGGEKDNSVATNNEVLPEGLPHVTRKVL